MRWLTSFAVWLIFSAALLAGPKVEIIVAEKAPPLEQRARTEVAEILKRLYQAEVTTLPMPSGKLPAIFIGSPTTNPALDFAKEDWPKLSEQGHLVKSTKYRDQPALLIGGGSPIATYWANREYAHHLGVRTMLYGDLDPIAPPEFSLAGIDSTLEPALKTRGWEMDYHGAASFAAWPKADQTAFVRQLAKLKFNRLVLRVRAGDPFIEFPGAGGIQRKEGEFWSKEEYPASGDTAGRSAFGGAKFFDNPDFAQAQNEADRIKASKEILRAAITEAKALGMQTVFHIEPYDLPPEFDHNRVFENASLAGELARATVRAYIETYPEIEAVMIGCRSTYKHTPDFFADPAIWQRRDRSSVSVLAYSDYGDAIAHWRKKVSVSQGVVLGGHNSVWSLLDRELPDRLQPGSRELPLLGWLPEPLPQVAPLATAEVAEQLRVKSWDGFVVSSHSTFGCQDLSAYLLSRNSFAAQLTAERACEELLTPICGTEVHTRVSRAFEMVERAARKYEAAGVDLLDPRMMWKKYTAAEPPPEGWKDLREAYLNAMNEMYRANTRAREGSRSFTLYLARQFEFGFEYMNCLQALRSAGVAKKEKDKEKQLAELEKAIDSINSACNALAAVARSQSDRGLIASLNAQVYRPLLKELEKADAEE